MPACVTPVSPTARSLPQPLLGRWALLPALVRISTRISPGIFDAPVSRRVSVAGIRVVGLSTLLAWNEEVREAWNRPHVQQRPLPNSSQ